MNLQFRCATALLPTLLVGAGDHLLLIQKKRCWGRVGKGSRLLCKPWMFEFIKKKRGTLFLSKMAWDCFCFIGPRLMPSPRPPPALAAVATILGKAGQGDASALPPAASLGLFRGGLLSSSSQLKRWAGMCPKQW